MVFEAVAGQVLNNLSSGNLGIEIPYISTIWKAVGGVVALYIAYLIISTILAIRKNKELKKIRVLLEGIDSKLKKK